MGGPLQGSGAVRSYENGEILEIEKKRLELALAHLERSNMELDEEIERAGPDEEYTKAIQVRSRPRVPATAALGEPCFSAVAHMPVLHHAGKRRRHGKVPGPNSRFGGEAATRRHGYTKSTESHLLKLAPGNLPSH
jgi:hypothetical protein